MKKITYYEDIIKEMADEFAVDEKQIKEIMDLHVRYIHKLTKTPKVISILLPNLGTLHFNYLRAIATYNKSPAYKNHVPLIKSQLDLIESLHKKHKDLVHRRRNYFTIFKKYFYKDKKERMKIHKSEIYKKIELKQNKMKI